ncbi:MAG: 3-hydroxyacyl-ACP dehydratase FabZ [Gammaproteobacteria bacterium]
MKQSTTLDVHEIMERLPHRYPFLLVDRVVECIPGESITVVKNVSANEPYFAGHFPDHMIMPGVLIIEAMAQAAGLLAIATVNEKKQSGTIYYFVGIDKARFKRPVVPGDQLTIKATITSMRTSLQKFDARAEVDGQLVAKGELLTAPNKVGRD